MTVLLVGRGLLGARVHTDLVSTAADVRCVSVPWSDQEAALAALLGAAGSAAEGAADGAWDLAWCAGAGVVGTSAEVLTAEVELVRRFVAELDRPPRAVFLASSAGGLYAGSTGLPFTEDHDPHPASPYGHAKLEIEHALAGLAERGTRVAIARIANLYGPGQDLTKPQGLVSQLCLSRLTGRPLGVYVSVDTLRDYVYVDDAARVATAMLGRVAGEPPGTVVVKIVGSGHATSIAGLVGAATRAFRRRPPVVYAARRNSGQVRDLRFRSLVWTDLDALVSTPLLVGLRATAAGVEAEHRAGRLVGMG
jgi:UDP-glucose 4-epimerase